MDKNFNKDLEIIKNELSSLLTRAEYLKVEAANNEELDLAVNIFFAIDNALDIAKNGK